MFDAGSAVFTLSGHVVRAPFEDYGRLVETARKQKEHVIQLGAKTASEGFDKFMRSMGLVRDESVKTETTVKGSMDSMASSTEKMATASTASFNKVVSGQKGLADSVVRTADVHKAAADSIVKDNARIAESTHNLGGGGRGGGGGRPGTGGTPEEQAKRTSAAWKDGFNSLANIGKWVSAGILGVGAISIKFAADFQRQMELVRTQAGYSQKEVDALSKSVLRLAPAVGIGPTKLAEGLFHIASSGIDAAHAMDVLRIAAEGAKVGNANLEDVTNALVAIWRTAPHDIHSISEAMGVMNDIVGKGNLRMQDLTAALTTGILPAAKAVGLGLRDVGAALDVMTARGVPAEEGATRLRTVLGLIADPTAKAQKALSQLGFSHDRLAKDFRQHGLVFALQDLQRAMNNVFGQKLDSTQIREALTAYAQRLKDAGANTKTIEKDVALFHNQLLTTGEGAIKSSQLIADAFGGARMGTTMQIMIQNVDDVKKHFDDLNKAGAAQRFQQAWQATQKDFSVQVSQMWAGLQKLGIQLGDYLIPKVKDLIKWLDQAGHWMGRHKALAEALAIAFGTLLTAAITAFFARFISRTIDGIASIGKFGKAIYDIPAKMREASRKIITDLEEQKKALRDVERQAGITADALGAEGESVTGAVPGGRGGGIAEEALGSIEGMITGVKGTTAPGSLMNPLAVVVMASESYGLGARGAAAEAQTASTLKGEVRNLETTGGGVVLPPGVRDTRGVAAAAAPAAEQAVATEAASGLGLTGLVGTARAGITNVAGRALGAAGVAGGGLIAGQLIGSLVPGKAGQAAGAAATYAGIGAGIGSLIAPGIGTAIGAALGGATGLVSKLTGIFESAGQKLADHFSKGFGGTDRQNLQNQVAKDIDAASKLLQGTRGTRTIPGGTRFGGSVPIPITIDTSQLTGDKLAKYQSLMHDAGTKIAAQLEKGWSSFKFQDEPTMFKQLRTQVGRMPAALQAGAVESAFQFARGLESQGKLVKGSADQLLMDAQQAFPGFAKYLGLQGKASAEDFAKAFNFDKVDQSTLTSLNQIANHFSVVTDALNGTDQDAVKRSADMIRVLKQIAQNGTGPMKKQAEADIKDLKNQMANYFAGMQQDVEAKMAAMTSDIQKGSQSAQATATQNFQKFANNVHTAMSSGTLSTQKGSQLISDAVVKTLKAFGDQKLPQALINAQELAQSAIPNPPQLSGASTPRGHATGGILPGSEFGLGDAMTLIDPHGRAVAKMAGDEAIFNRHQMPYVEAGLQALGFAGAHDLWHKVNVPHGAPYEKGGKLPGFAAGGYVYPFPPGTAIGRTDQGIDANLPVGAPIGPMGRSKVAGIIPNWYQGQPFIYWQLMDGPRAGRYAYVAEQITGLARPGQVLGPHDAVARYAASGTGIEYGWATSTGATLARATTGYKEGQVTPAGSDIRSFIQGLAHGVIFGGGGGALGLTPIWHDIKAPKVTGTGAPAEEARFALKKMTAAANAYGRRISGSISSVGWTGGGNAQANEALGRRMMMAMGWGADQWPSLLALWTQESGWNQSANNPSSGAYGIPQSLPASKMASAGPDWRTNPATQIAWGLNYIKSTYGSPAAAEAHERAHNWYARGGLLPGFQSGGHRSPWAPLPSSTGSIPGYRPIRTRRGRGGLHTVGGSRTGGSRGAGSTRSTHRTKVKQVGRPKQTLSQTTANTLTSLGFGSFASDQNLLGTLDSQYQNQENLFNLFSPQGLSQDELDTLMNIREQEWDILYKEYVTLPAAIAAMQNNVNALAGTTHPGHWKLKGSPALAGTGLLSKGVTGALTGHPSAPTSKTFSPVGHRTWVPPTTTGGVVPALTAEVNSTESEISQLQHELQLETRKISAIHHTVSASVMGLADNLANQIAQGVSNVNAINNQKLQNSQKRINLQIQIRNIPSSSSSSSSLSVNQIVSGVLSGALPSTGTATANPTKKRLQDQISGLHTADLHLSAAERGVNSKLKQLRAQHAAANRRLRKSGFDEAWSVTLTKYKIQDRIYTLQQTLKKLKASLKSETSAQTSDQNALQTLQNWQSGGLQGTESIKESLESEAFNILDLYQQGASLPTSGRTEPTLKMIEDFLTSIGLQLPPGLTQGTATATAQQAYADFQTFQASRAALFQQFGSNFVAAGTSPLSNAAGLGAGLQFYGAGSGSAAGLGGPGATGPGLQGGGWLGDLRVHHNMNNPGPGGTTVNIHNHFAAGPPDPHTWSSGVAFEMRAQV